MAKSHVQRPAVQLRYGKAQLVIFPAGERPAQRLLRINRRSIASEYGMASRSMRAAAAGFENMAQIGDQAVGEIDSRCRRVTQRRPCSTRGIGRR